MFPSWVGIVPENWFEYRYLLFSTIYEIWNRNNELWTFTDIVNLLNFQVVLELLLKIDLNTDIYSLSWKLYENWKSNELWYLQNL